jgi:ATP-dependent DNA helicase RecQ
MGRAGRDGEPAHAVLFHRSEDLGRQRFLTGVRRSGDDDGDEHAARRATWVETRLEMIRTYAETDVCRRQQLLSSLGEPFEGPCDACDVCDAARERASAGHVDASRDADGAPADAPWSVPGTEVVHATWGSGRVLSLAGDRLTVLFDEAGYRNLSARTVDECGLLAVAE